MQPHLTKIWPQNKEEICKEILSSAGRIKIVLKTRNEEFLLRKWLEHHLAIVGSGNLIVMDNGSDSSEVSAIYQEFKNDVMIFGFEGGHNFLHLVESFAPLYGALRKTCSYYSFLDTDEFLRFRIGSKLVSTSDLCAEVEVIGNGDVLPGVWLPNYPGCEDIFFINDYPGRRLDGLTWGKPLIPSALDIKGYVNHNIQLASSNQSACTKPGLFISHYTRLFPEQRIKQNIQKLISRKVIQHADQISSLLETDLQSHPDGNVNLYLREIANLSEVDVWPRKEFPPNGCLRINESGDITFGDEETQIAFQQLSDNFENLWAEVRLAENRQ